jgi:hypothetical protein
MLTIDVRTTAKGQPPKARPSLSGKLHSGYMANSGWLKGSFQTHQRKKVCCYWNSNKPFTELAERVGFEPTVPCGTPDFESGTFGHSAISP